MSTLLVCHSTGDTNVIKATAEALSNATEQEVLILLIGQVGQSHFKSLPEDHPLIISKNVSLIFLADIIGEESMQASEDASMSADDLKKVEAVLNRYNINKAFIGTPSKMHAQAPYQIAQLIADKLEVGLTYNDYLFYEPGHEYWDTVNEKQAWQEKYNWLLPLLDSQNVLSSFNPNVSSAVVGHPSIDASIAANTGSTNAEETANIRQNLQVKDASFLFVSGTKDLQDDQSLLKTILEATQDLPSGNKIEIRFGIHPGLSDLQKYLECLTQTASDYPKVRSNLKFILTDQLKSRIDTKKLDESLLLSANINGNQGAMAADGIACAVPATLVSQAAIEGKPSYSNDSNRLSFLPSYRMAVGEKHVGNFIKNVAKQERFGVASRDELKLSNESATDIMTNMLNIVKPPV